jgi:hypothetical protein
VTAGLLALPKPEVTVVPDTHHLLLALPLFTAVGAAAVAGVPKQAVQAVMVEQLAVGTLKAYVISLPVVLTLAAVAAVEPRPMVVPVALVL